MSSLSLINKARHLQVFLSYNVYECNFKKKPYPHTFRVEKSITSTGEGVNHCDDGVEGTFSLCHLTVSLNKCFLIYANVHVDIFQIKFFPVHVKVVHW